MTQVSQNIDVKPKEPTNTGPVGFKSGMAATVGPALATLERALMEISSLKNDMFVTQANAGSEIATAYSHSQVNLGKQEMTESMIQGSFSVFGGILGGTMGLYGMSQTSELKPLSEEAKGSQAFRNSLETEAPEEILEDGTTRLTVDNREEVDNRFEEILSGVRSGDYELTDGAGNARDLNTKAEGGTLTDKQVIDLVDEPKRTQLKEAADERVTAANGKVAEMQQSLRVSFDKYNMASTSINGITNGAGSIGAGVMKKLEALTQADNTQYSAAQTQMTSLSNETQTQADQDLQSALSLTQLLPEIDRSNNAILSA